MSVSGKYRGDKHSLNRLNYCEKNKKMEISSQAGYIQPNFAFQINTPSKMLKNLNNITQHNSHTQRGGGGC